VTKEVRCCGFGLTRYASRSREERRVLYKLDATVLTFTCLGYVSALFNYDER